MKNQEKRTEYLKKLKELVGLKNELPTDFYGVPSAQPMSLWYFGDYEKNRDSNVIDVLWNLAEEAVAGNLKANSFQTTLTLPGVKIAKLTQGLFWLNPNTFYPIDAHKNYLEDNGINPDVKTLDDYLNVLDKVKSTFQKPFYEVSSEAWRYNNDGYDEEPEDRNIESEQTGIMQHHFSPPSLNTILYGPPGTGKTYNTVNKAIEIINPKFFDDAPWRNEIKKEYERLRTEGQIEFITFHQSMSYEDFIEGIKPKKPDEGDEYIKYIIEEGLFKRIASRAAYKPTPQAAGFSLTENEFTNASFYKISLGNTAIADDEQIYRYCIDSGYIALGWGGAINFTGKTEHDIQLMVPSELEKFAAQSVNYFIHYLKTGDYVVVSYGNLRLRAIGKVTGEYEYKNAEGLEVKQFRKVKWLIKDVNIPVEELYNKQFSQQTIYKLNKLEIRKDFFIKNQEEKQSSTRKKNYVLIIDEINRGNIAQIFGELITLIEPDKRKGMEEELEVMLPYSKNRFSVPSNLYIIGTMNTADRSVEALDTALRRRFVFEQTLPDASLLSPQNLILELYDKYSDVSWNDKSFRRDATKLYHLIGIDESFEASVRDDNNRSYSDDSKIRALGDSRFNGVNLKNLLLAINSRIQKLIDIDHQIGHAFFMNVISIEQLYSVFYQKIIPQLQEYFYGDYGKIGLVLGKNFVLFESKEQTFSFAKFDYEDQQDLAQKRIYTINRFQNENGEIDYTAFANAIKTVYE
jgi:5-methylcytosine-specific restriction protein B